MLPTAAEALDSAEANLVAMKDDSRSLSVIALK